VVSFTPRPLYLEGNNPWYSLDRRIDRPQSRSGHSGGEEKNSKSLSGIEPRSSTHPARSQSLYRLSYKNSFYSLNRPTREYFYAFFLLNQNILQIFVRVLALVFHLTCKVKLSVRFNCAPHHEGVLGNGDITPLIL
jgi:hypothetical protein